MKGACTRPIVGTDEWSSMRFRNLVANQNEAKRVAKMIQANREHFDQERERQELESIAFAFKHGIKYDLQEATLLTARLRSEFSVVLVGIVGMILNDADNDHAEIGRTLSLAVSQLLEHRANTLALEGKDPRDLKMNFGYQRAEIMASQKIPATQLEIKQ